MSVKPYREQYVIAAAADHEFLARTIESCRRLFTGDQQTDITKEFDGLRHLLVKKLPEHFSYEEQLVFPALLADQPPATLANTIVDLCEEHVALLLEAKILKAMLGHGTLKSCTTQLWNKMLDFFQMLEQHAAKEDALYQLPPPASQG